MNPSRSGLAAAAIAVLFAQTLPAGTPATSEWPGFRGPGAGGTYLAEWEALRSESIALKIGWKRPLGSGYSGVAVAGGLVVTAFSDGVEDLLIAFDEESGDELWRTPLDATYKGHDGSHGGPIATPLLADGRVFMLAPRGKFVALDAKTGAQIWTTDLPADHAGQKPHYGFASSPLQADGTLIIHLGGEAAFAGFDPATGKRKWTAGTGYVQYQAPVLATLPGQRPAVFAASDSLVMALHPATGEALWQMEINAGLPEREAHDPRGSGSLVPVPAGDDRLFLKHTGEKAQMVRLNRDGPAYGTATLWESGAIRNTYNVPVIHDGFIYALSSRFLTCVDAATGDSKWRSREPGDGFLALADGHLIIATKNGGVHVARASSNGYEERAALPVFETLIWAPPSVANGRIFVRSMDGLARLDVVAGVRQAADAPGLAAPASAFERFLADLTQSPDKPEMIDAYLKQQKSLPIVEGDRIHFVYRGPGQDLALGCETVGARQERSMTRVPDTDLFYCSMPLEPDARVNYIFIRDYEDILDPLNDRRETSVAYTAGMEVSFGRKPPFEMSWVAMPHWKPSPSLAEPPPATVRGTVERHEFDSPTISAKLGLAVYLPAGYQPAGERYPVVYFVDGQAALERGRLQNVLDNEIDRRVAPLIAVCIETPPRQMNPALSAAIAKDVVPFIDGKYPTRAEPAGRAVAGAGFHGAVALTAALENPTVFGKAAIQSPFMLRSFEETFGPALANLPQDARPAVHLLWGKYDMRNPHEAWDMADGSRSAAAGLKSAGLTVTGGEDHMGTDWCSWKHRLADLLAAVAPK